MAGDRSLRSVLTVVGLCVVALICSITASRLVERPTVTRLPGGYELFRTSAATTILLPPDDVRVHRGYYGPVVAAKITMLGVDGPFIYGLVVSSPRSELAGDEKPGYFMLNTSDHLLTTSLSNAGLERKLGEEGVSMRLHPVRMYPHR